MKWLMSGRCIPVLWIATIGILLTLAMAGCASPRRTSQYLPPLQHAVDSTSVTYTWTPPVDGTLVSYYLLECTTGQQWIASRAKLRITVPADTPHRVKVRGTDEHGVTGPWSAYSEEWPGRSERDTLEIDNPIGRVRR